MALSKNIASTIVGRFGGVRPMARALAVASGRRVAPTTVQGWLARGRIPAARQSDVLAAAKSLGVPLAPADFFPASEEPVPGPARDLPAREGPCELVTNAEMGEADRRAAAAGTPGDQLMETAGAGVVRILVERFARAPVTVLCGPGNNGGDGFVIARHLRRLGWPVRLALLGPAMHLKGDAARNARRWSRAAGPGAIEPLAPSVLDGAALVVDAMFGAGLARPLDGAARAVAEAVNAARLPVVAVDVPSGIDGDTGQVMGAAVRAALTVTFFRLKPGHLLYPGRALCGEVRLIDIGIPDAVLEPIAPRTFRNGPALWGTAFPWPAPDSHKYARGQAVVLGGTAMTGAARLAARACMRVGAGLVTVAAAPEAVPFYARDAAALLTVPLAERDDLARYLADARRRAVLVGPGLGIGRATRAHAQVALELGRKVCLDADAITSFADWPPGLFETVARGAEEGGCCVLTPHEGEFARLFPDLEAGAGRGGDRLARARGAAARAGAVVLLKGADTVIAAPDGRAAINHNAPPWLATGGTGDVLAGLVTGLLAQGMAPFEAAAAAAWIHGEAARNFGPGLIADDLPGEIPRVLRGLARNSRTAAKGLDSLA